jgi:ferredoxin-type protein NapF
MDRRELFSSLFSSKSKEKKEIIVSPPYYCDEDSFSKECISCEDTPCITFCQEKIIVLKEDHTPVLQFQNSGCTYCDECAIHCPKEVLSVENKAHIDKNFEIDMLQCMSWSNTMCFSCKDPCLEDAIEFLGIFKPSINLEKCTSCGFCVGVCPTNAIILKEKGK